MGMIMSDQDVSSNSSLGFEQALAQLEQLVAQMETGELPLEQSLLAYQKGVQLAQVCQQRLDQVEHQVQVLQGQLMKPLASIDPESDGKNE